MPACQKLPDFFVENNASPPMHMGTRYDKTGHFLPEPGNTVICHLKSGASSSEAVLNLREKMKTLPGADCLAFTAPSSLHMTLFQGIIEYRRKLSFWPNDLPLDTPIDDMTELFLARLRHFNVPDAPFRVAPAEIRPTGLTVVPADDESAEALSVWRERLASLFGYKHPDHDSYRLHITFAYLTDWLPDDALPEWQEKTSAWLDQLRDAAPEIELASPAFCTFTDMNHFEELLMLR